MNTNWHYRRNDSRRYSYFFSRSKSEPNIGHVSKVFGKGERGKFKAEHFQYPLDAATARTRDAAVDKLMELIGE